MFYLNILSRKELLKQKMDKEEKRIILILILLLLIILIALIISNIIGKVGYVNSDNSEQLDLIEVTQNDIGWDMLEELNIFKNKKFDNKNIIAPRSSGTYSFLVNNVTDKNLIYDVQLREINDYNINMKYRLKLENVYVAGNKEEWVNVEDVNLENIIVTAGSTNFYTLEWCWVDDDTQDTKIGSLNYADYTLRIKVGAQIYDKTVGDNN